MDNETVDMIAEGFRKPPEGFGVVPFYWWLGDRITKEKLLYHLKQIENHHISGLQINYAHSDQGGRSFGLTYPGEPPVFSDEWWELLGWFLKEAGKRNIAVSLSDYTLGSPGQGYYADWILEKYPQMQGRLLECFRKEVIKGEAVKFGPQGMNVGTEVYELPEGCEYLYSAIRGKNGDISPLPELQKCMENKTGMRQMGQDGELLLVYSYKKEYSIDPMYPGVGEKYIENFFGQFEEHFPEECGKGLNFFFSDELNFNIGGNLWNSFFREEFLKRKGYDILPKLYLIFEKGRPEAVKTRLDYYDVIVSLEEENYFRPIYMWHERRHMIYGCDHGGRGRDVLEFGDYMRTQKYNQGVGCDQPKLQSDIIKNKVASSISHLNQRPRVWLEGFYGSGWGTSTEQLTDAIARNFVMGHNLLSLHGFYYSTYGGFWEWAPPCNCVRAPYWKDMEQLTGAVERMSYLMSRGVHSCGIGIVYPVAAMEGGIDGQRSVETAFSLGEAFYRRGIDFDFLDYESIVFAGTQKGQITMGGENYQLVILPEMKTVRGSMYQKLAAAALSGIGVMAVGSWPAYADCDISDSGTILREKGIFAADVEAALRYVTDSLDRDVIPSLTKFFYMNHRKAAELDLYMTYGIPVGETCFFRGKGHAFLMNPWNGGIYRLKAEEVRDDGLIIKMPAADSEFPILALGEMDSGGVWEAMPEKTERIYLPEIWDFTLIPTLDNTWGDFELPASSGILPCMVKQVRQGKRVWKTGYGPWFLYKECFRGKDDFFTELKAAAAGKTEGYREYVFSMRYGVDGDPGHQGYHGLKGKITDDFLRIGEPEETLTDIKLRPYSSGVGKIFLTQIFCEEDTEAEVLTGELKPEKLYVNGFEVTHSGRIYLTKGINLVAAGYLEYGRTHLVFAGKGYHYGTYPLSMKWYKMQGMLPFTVTGLTKTDGTEDEREKANMTEKRTVYWFQGPPALEKLHFSVKGKVKRITANGIEAYVTQADNEVTAVFGKGSLFSEKVELELEPDTGYEGGAVFDSPLAISCGTGKSRAVDWSQSDALKYYSGGASYSQEIIWEKEVKQVWLEMDRVVSSAEVYVNGVSAGIRLAPPWRVEVGGLLHKGKNHIEIRVYNTLGNHYEYLPTRYKSGIESGLIGQVSLNL